MPVHAGGVPVSSNVTSITVIPAATVISSITMGSAQATNPAGDPIIFETVVNGSDM